MEVGCGGSIGWESSSVEVGEEIAVVGRVDFGGDGGSLGSSTVVVR